MTDYAKHIEAFDRYRSELDADDAAVEHYTAAIELMRAAAPKSPEEWAKHIEYVIRGVLTVGDGRSPAIWQAAFERECDAARAEGYARGKVDYLDAYLDKEQERKIESEASAREIADVERELQNKLSAAQAEIERLRADEEGTRDALTTEIERLQGVCDGRAVEIDVCRECIADLEVKLEMPENTIKTTDVDFALRVVNDTGSVVGGRNVSELLASAVVALRADAERSQKALAIVQSLWTCDKESLTAEIAERDAEIERVNNAANRHAKAHDQLQTKLTNLREAAERVRDIAEVLNYPRILELAVEQLRMALEAIR